MSKVKEQILYYVFNQTGALNSPVVKSLKSKDFLLSDNIIFDTDDSIVKNAMWGACIKINAEVINLLLINCSVDADELEYTLLVQLSNSPPYCCSIGVSNLDLSTVTYYNLSYYYNDNWNDCDMYMYGMFLAGMEKLKDITLSWTKIENIDMLKKMAISYIEYNDARS